MKNILITGINGSGASYLADYIKDKKKIKIYGTHRKNNILKEKNIINLKKKKNIFFIKCNLNSYSSVKKILSKRKFAYIFHIASNADVKKSFYSPRKIIEGNNSCTLNILEASRELSLKSKIIICSTSEVYGEVQKKFQPINENAQISPLNPYAVSKTFQDLLSQVYFKAFKLNIIITRMFTYINPRRTNLVATAFAKQIVEIEKGKRKIVRHGNLNSVRALLDIRDAMNAYWLAAVKGKPGEIYNIGSIDRISIKDLLLSLCSKCKKKIILKKDDKLLRPTDIKLQIPSSKKFKKHTGWKQKFNKNEAIQKLLDDCRKLY